MSPSLALVAIETIDGGAVIEQVNHVLGKVWENVLDPNTDPEAKRTITLTVVVEPNDTRENASFEYTVSMKVPGPKSRSTAVFMGEKDGQAIAVTRDLRQVDAFEPELPAGVTPLPRREIAQAGGRS